MHGKTLGKTLVTIAAVLFAAAVPQTASASPLGRAAATAMADSQLPVERVHYYGYRGYGGYYGGYGRGYYGGYGRGYYGGYGRGYYGRGYYGGYRYY